MKFVDSIRHLFSGMIQLTDLEDSRSVEPESFYYTFEAM